ncbi:MAG: DUF1080 domain-containing protein [Acidobacteriota bacterium]|nr:DUF1080 domain-containing protein [Acidobacteriota bacterium]
MTREHQPSIGKGGRPGGFELKLPYRLTGEGGNRCVEYRNDELPFEGPRRMKGYQADSDAKQTYSGQIYEERNRGFLALRGQISRAIAGKAGSIGTLRISGELDPLIRSGDWNDIDAIALGNTLLQLVNGHVMSILVDDDAANRIKMF